MKVIETIAGYRQWRTAHHHDTIGLVPTMGYLHEGHLSLVKKAREKNHHVVLSIFVNPLQFGPTEDFDHYPRDMERDLSIAREAGVDVVFAPTVYEMYPRPLKTRVHVDDVTSRLCGASRPGHFDGVSTVVSKLFHIIQPDRAYFGQKDAQQVAVIEKMIDDLNIPVALVCCPIVREADGLAMSSRNVYLTPDQRSEASVLYQSTREIEAAFEAGIRDPDMLLDIAQKTIAQAQSARIDYTDILSYPELGPIKAGDQGEWIYAVAAYFGNTRLIENVILREKGE